ncbi:hypothetical protein VSDG_08131 [Cytospora chrysosperma]|uniref:intramembrane prenyl-peptidase Rce1 n=1 Tax=Cytospora chrysosperma TaxID=252740 RepID=A0A423VHG5_CYTCH|nr:hypothetical protein VSDG_08131 [Valsa sordida]
MPSIMSYLTDILYRKEPKAPPPPPPPGITTATAILLLVLYTLLYVVPFYLSPRTRPSPTLSRDAPSVIRARIASVTVTCAAASLITFYVLVSRGRYGNADVFHAMGYWPAGAPEALRALLLTALLFTGPLFESLVAEGGWRDWLALGPVKEVMNEITAWRNIVAGPLTEEVLFRSAAIPLMVLARTPLATTIFVSPLVFGLAHVHHFYEFRVSSRGPVPVSAALLRSAFQLGYTSVFGAYATFVYLRTGSLLAVFAVHVLCNCVGLPRVWGRVRGPARFRESDGRWLAPAPLGRAWSMAYYVLLVAGAAAWWRGLE